MKQSVDKLKDRNKKLQQQLNDIKFQLEFDKNYNSESLKKAEDLISDLEQIKSKWLEIIEELEEKSNEYDRLNKDLVNAKQQMIKIMEDAGYSVSLKKKLQLKFGGSK